MIAIIAIVLSVISLILNGLLFMNRLSQDDINKIKNNTFKDLVVEDSITINSSSGKPIVINKTNDKKVLISLELDGKNYRNLGVDEQGDIVAQ